MKRKTFLKNAFVLTLGGFFAKGLGAIYRIPLANLLGGYGMGLYQMAYPLFCVLLTFSSAGVPNAFARTVARENAEGRDSFATVRSALCPFARLGLCGTLLMLLLAPLMARVQGEYSLAGCYFALAPSVLFVSVIAVLRGYFQGKREMSPTALSEILEQCVKLVLGLLFATLAKGNAVRAVQGTLFAVTLSEVVALCYLLLRYRGERRRFLRCKRPPRRGIFRSVFSAMLAASLLPLSQTVDSVMIVRLLSRYTPDAVSLYGLFSGGAISLINLPASLSFGLASASVPALSEAFARGNRAEGRRRALYALCFTLAIALPFAVGLATFARPCVRLLFPALSAEDSSLLVSLLRICAPSAVTLAGVQTLSACLTGMGRAKRSALSMGIAVLVKFAVQFLLVRDPAFSVYGAAIASDTCFLLAFFLNLYYTMKKEKREENSYDYGRRLGSGAGRFERARKRGNLAGGKGARAHGAHRVLSDAERDGRGVRIARFRLRKQP